MPDRSALYRDDTTIKNFKTVRDKTGLPASGIVRVLIGLYANGLISHPSLPTIEPPTTEAPNATA
jgi:hypothetical protein